MHLHTQRWYSEQMRRLFEWLNERASISLHPLQLTALTAMQRKCFAVFELQGVPGTTLESMAFQGVKQRLAVEETIRAAEGPAGALGADGGGGGGMVATFGGQLANQLGKLNLGGVQQPLGGLLSKCNGFLKRV